MNAPVVHKSQRSESVLLGPYVVAYPNFHEKRTKRANGTPLKTPRNDGVVLVPKLHTDPQQCANYQKLWAMVWEAASKAWPGIGFPQGGFLPIQDGDAPPKPKAPVPGQAPVTPKEYPWRKGHWIIEVTHNLDAPPSVAIMQGTGQGMEIPSRVIAGRTMYKSGDVWILNVHAWTFQHPEGKFGVNFGFDAALWIKEGPAIGNSGPRSAAQIFAGVANIASANATAPMAAPGMVAPPMAPAAPPAPGGVAYPGPAAAPPVAPMAPAAPPAPPAAPMAPMAQAMTTGAPVPPPPPLPPLPPMPGR